MYKVCVAALCSAAISPGECVSFASATLSACCPSSLGSARSAAVIVLHTMTHHFAHSNVPDGMLQTMCFTPHLAAECHTLTCPTCLRETLPQKLDQRSSKRPIVIAHILNHMRSCYQQTVPPSSTGDCTTKLCKPLSTKAHGDPKSCTCTTNTRIPDKNSAASRASHGSNQCLRQRLGSLQSQSMLHHRVPSHVQKPSAFSTAHGTAVPA